MPIPTSRSQTFKLSEFLLSPLVSFSLVLFFISLGDAVISYAAPVYIEDILASPFLMGLIVSTTSVVGIICDALIPKIFPNKNFKFYTWVAIGTAVIFPLFFLLGPASIPTFLWGMLVWGIYYEFSHFSGFHFVRQFIPQSGYATAWGVISAFKATAYLVGPLIASMLISNSFHQSFGGSLIFFATAGLCLLAFTHILKTKRQAFSTNSQPSDPAHPFTVLKSWFVLMKKVWPLYIFLIVICLIDTVFWTTGTVLSEKLKNQSIWGAFLLPAYSLPSLFAAAFTGPAARLAGKKRAAFVTAAISGLLLIPLGFVSHIYAILGLVFLSSAFISISFPEITAVFEDYVTRMGKSGDDMVGLQASAFSLAYIVGPIVAGGIASLLGDNFAFSVVGLLVLIVSLICLVIVPRKVRLPQKELYFAPTFPPIT